MQVERVGLHAVELTICTDFWLPLVEIRLGSGFAVQLLYVIGGSVEQIAVVGLLVRRGEAPEDQDVLVRDLV